MLCTRQQAQLATAWAILTRVGVARCPAQFEAAERNAAGFIVRAIERSLEFDINQKVTAPLKHQGWLRAGSNQASPCRDLVHSVCPLSHLLQDKFMRNAAHWAAEAGSIEALECLMDYRIDADATECNGRSALAHPRQCSGGTGG